MKPKIIRTFTVFSFFVAASLPGLALESACTPGEKAVTKTALDIAGDACRFAFWDKPAELPPGVALEDFCEAEQNLQPFVDDLLSTREGLAHKLGTDRPLLDAGVD